MCHTLPGRWSVPLVLLLSTGCASSSLQLLQAPPPYLGDVRSEYFTANPESPYRDNVTRSTVVAGMGRYDVLASWGHPVRRLSDGSGDEQWTYFDADIDSGDVMEYDLMFRRGVLDSWTRRPIRNGGLAYRTVPELPDQLTTDSPTDRPGGKRVPKN